MIRALILSATIAALVVMWGDRLAPIESAPVVPYCNIGREYAPCAGLKYTLNI